MSKKPNSNFNLDDEKISVSKSDQKIINKESSFDIPQISLKKVIEKKIVQYYLPKSLIDEIDKFCKSNNVSKTEAVEAFLKLGLNYYKNNMK